MRIDRLISRITARAVQARRGEKGPLTPDHLREAYRMYQQETGRVGASRPFTWEATVHTISTYGHEALLSTFAGCCRTVISFSPLHLIPNLRQNTCTTPCAPLVQMSLIPLSAEELPYHHRLLRALMVQHTPSCSFAVLFIDIPFPIVSHSARSKLQAPHDGSAITAF
jgi:hypothetical protein